jgi:hypothetical protein
MRLLQALLNQLVDDQEQEQEEPESPTTQSMDAAEEANRQAEEEEETVSCQPLLPVSLPPCSCHLAQ